MATLVLTLALTFACSRARAAGVRAVGGSMSPLTTIHSIYFGIATVPLLKWALLLLGCASASVPVGAELEVGWKWLSLGVSGAA